MLLIRCAWHPRYFVKGHRLIGLKQWWILWRFSVSHGMCWRCRAKWVQDKRERAASP